MNNDDVEIIDAPKKRRGGRPPQMYDPPPKDDVQKQFKFALAVAKINTGRIKSPEELEQRFEDLFNIAFEQGIIPRYEHLVLVSGLPKRTFFDYGNEDGQYSPSQIYSPVVKKAKNLISAMEAGLATTGKIPPVVYIFREKNYGGLKDVQEIQSGPIQDATRPKNEQEILDALPDCPTKEVIDVTEDSKGSSASNGNSENS